MFRPGPSPAVSRILNIGHHDPDMWDSKETLFKVIISNLGMSRTKLSTA